MLKRAPINAFTVEEYLAFEDASPTKHEFYDGKIYDMAGASPDHALIQANLTAVIHSQLTATPCRVFSSELRIGIEQIDLYTYPDVTVVCGNLEIDPRSKTTVTNPIVLVEVLSPSTRAYDRGDKFNFYKQIPSLQEYVLVEAERPHIEVLRRAGKRWEIDIYKNRDAIIALESIGIQVSLRDVYSKISWFKG